MVKGAEILMRLVGNGVFGTPLSMPVGTVMTDELLAQVFDLAKAHDVAHIVASALDKNNLLFGSAFEGLYREQMYDAVIKSENQSFVLRKISEAFEKAQISHIPLKGSVIKELYPESWMRTSCDIDILIHKEDLSASSEVLCKELDFVKEKESSHDVSFVNSGKVCIELHFTLMEKEKSKLFGNITDRVWDFAAPQSNGYRYILKNEMVYFYHIAHMARHFRSGGCGVRPFVDLQLMINSRKYRTDEANQLLEEAGLVAFADCVEKQSGVWFSGKEHNDTTLLIEEYILAGGSFGSEQTRLKAEKQIHESEEKYVLSRLFVPSAYFKNNYPIVNKYKFLLPFFQIYRIFSFAFGKKKDFRKNRLEKMKNITENENEKTRLLFEVLGLK